MDWTFFYGPFYGRRKICCKSALITVTGKAFYDIAHAPANHSNRRRTPKDYAVWEIHPVMKMEVLQ